MSDLKVVDREGGWHDIGVEFSGAFLPIVSVRPVGTLQLGDTFSSGLFHRRWVPDLLAALQMADKIAARPEPWAPAEGLDFSTCSGARADLGDDE